jgi:hypothetical protein
MVAFMGMALDHADHRRPFGPDVAMATHPLRRRAAYFSRLAGMFGYPSGPIRDIPYSGDAMETHGAEAGMIDFEALSRYRQAKVASIRAHVRFAFGIQGDDWQTGGHTFRQGQTKAFAAQR